jgi:tripartite-type tricarboxylate transporter receptor subunit TctC
MNVQFDNSASPDDAKKARLLARSVAEHFFCGREAMNTNARTLLGAALVAIGLAASVTAIAQSYPARPIRIILPFTAGGGTDLLARLLAQRFTESLGQPAVVDNRPGAGGNLGADFVVKALPDGYTLLLSTASTAVNVTLYPKLPFDIRKDLIAITQIGRSPIVVTTHPSVPARNIRELVELSKKVKGGLNFGSNGSGTTSHLAGVMLGQFSGIRLTHVPYKGASASVTALLSGEVEIGFQATTSVLPLLRTGKLRALAVTTKRKVAALPEIPTVDSMYPGFDIDQWYIVFAPVGTPAAIVNRLHAEVVKALQHPEVKAWMQRESAEPVGSPPSEVAAFLNVEVEKYAKIVKASGAKPDQ